MTDKLDTPLNEKWDCYDKRLPKNNEIVRPPVDMEFIMSMAEGQLQPICMVHDTKNDTWKIGFGRGRLLALRYIKDNNIDGVTDVWVSILEGDAIRASHIALVENAQRRDNPIGDYIAIQEILLNQKPTPSWEDIARTINKLPAYVKNLDRAYCKTPPWALTAALEGSIKATTAEGLGKLSDKEQKVCKKFFEVNKKLPKKVIDETKRAVKQDQVATLCIATDAGIAAPFGREWYSRVELQSIADLLNVNDIHGATSAIIELLSQ